MASPLVGSSGWSKEDDEPLLCPRTAGSKGSHHIRMASVSARFAMVPSVRREHFDIALKVLQEVEGSCRNSLRRGETRASRRPKKVGCAHAAVKSTGAQCRVQQGRVPGSRGLTARNYEMKGGPVTSSANRSLSWGRRRSPWCFLVVLLTRGDEEKTASDGAAATKALASAAERKSHLIFAKLKLAGTVSKRCTYDSTLRIGVECVLPMCLSLADSDSVKWVVMGVLGVALNREWGTPAAVQNTYKT